MNETTHPDELLPFYVNATLEGEERIRVEAHLEHCACCRQEVDFLRTLRAGMQAGASATAPETAWPRLRRALRQTGTTRPSRRWLPAALAASLLVIVAQTALLLNRPESGGYTLSGSTLSGEVVQLRFDPSATEADIRRVLQAVEGTLIDGPGALGVYRVRLASPAADGRSIEARLAWLRSQQPTVRYVARD